MPMAAMRALKNSQRPEGVGKPPCANGACGNGRLTKPSCSKVSKLMRVSKAVRHRASSWSAKQGSV